MTDSYSKNQLEAVQVVVDRVSSYQDGAPEGTVENELRDGLSQAEIEISKATSARLAAAIEDEHGSVDAALRARVTRMTTRFGYTLMTEQSGPRELVRYAVAAEETGFDFAVSSDHYSPWLTEQGHSPYAWSVLGAVAQATERVGLMTYVTCPTMRYHPAVVAQKAATVCAAVRGPVHPRARAAARTSTSTPSARAGRRSRRGRRCSRRPSRSSARCSRGDLVTYRGDHFAVDAARLWDLPDDPVRIGDRRLRRAERRAVRAARRRPDRRRARRRADRGLERRRRVAPIGDGARAIGQIPICWDPDEKAAIERAHEQFRWFGGGWNVNADLPTTAGFASASQFVTPDDVADSIPCGPDLDKIVEAVSEFWEAGFTDIAVVQVGDEGQDRFLDEAAGPLLEKLRAAAPSDDGLSRVDGFDLRTPWTARGRSSGTSRPGSC